MDPVTFSYSQFAISHDIFNIISSVTQFMIAIAQRKFYIIITLNRYIFLDFSLSFLLTFFLLFSTVNLTIRIFKMYTVKDIVTKLTLISYEMEAYIVQ